MSERPTEVQHTRTDTEKAAVSALDNLDKPVGGTP